MNSHSAFVLLAILCFSPANLYADLILNPSFEDPVVNSPTQFLDGQIIGSGWQVIDGNTAYIIPDSAGQGTTPFGSQFLEIHSDTVGQTIDGLLVGNEYILSYYATIQTNSDYFGDGQITASIAGQDDVLAYSLSGNNPYGSAAFPWTNRTLNFIATSTSELLTFTATGEFNEDPLAAIDNISISAVPEPGSLIAVLVSLLICVHRRFRS